MLSAPKSSRVRNLLESAVQARIGSGIAAAWGKVDDSGSVQSLYVGHEGHARIAGRETAAIDAETFFDLASLTKILSTTSVAMVALERGHVRLDEPADGLPDPVRDPAPFTFGDLLSHTAGLSAWKPIYEKMIERFGSNLAFGAGVMRKDYFMREMLGVAPELPVGQKVVYSDIGFLRLQDFFETRFGAGLDRLAQEWVWAHLPDSRLHYRPVRMDSEGERFRIRAAAEKVAMTEFCPWRGLLQGQVHDDNCWSMGGIAGHAGVFGRLQDVVGWVQGLWNRSFVGLPTLSRFMQEVPRPAGARRGYGFDMPSLDGSGSTGMAFSPQSFGHLGFTGTSLWMDLQDGSFAVLLTNRVHPDRGDIRIRQLRQQFHTAVRSAC